MEDIQETFTRRILRRVSQRRERDRKEAMNRSAEISHRRSNILRAINDPSMSLVSCSTDMDDRQNPDRSYDSFRDGFNVTGYSCNDDNNNDEKSFDGNAKTRREEIPILVKVTEGNIEVPAKMIAELRKIEVIETANDTFDLTRARRSSMAEIEAATKTPERRSVSALSTEAVVEMCNRVSSVLTDIRHDPVDPSDFQNTDFFVTADREAINDKSVNFGENRPKESTEEIDNSRKKKIPISPETPVRRSVSADLTTEAVVAMCNRVSSVLTDIRCDLSDPRDFRHTDLPRIAECANVRSRDVIEGRPEESTGSDADFSPKKSAESWDEDKFLEVALGEDRYGDVTEEDADPADRTEIEPIADRSPLRRRVTEALNLPSPKTTPDRSFTTLDRSMRFYRTLSHRIKKKFRPIFRADRKEATPEEPPTIPRLDDTDRIRDLLREVKVQQTIINQSTKALDLCTSLKQFTESTERVESERSLLLASLRGKAALEEIKSLTSDEKREAIFSEKGEVTISEMSLDLRSSLGSEQEETEWFVVVVSHGLRVWATRAVNCRSEDTRVHFPGSVSIASLTPAFKILVQVYSLKLGRDAYSDEDKYGTKTRTRRRFWTSSSSVFRKVDVSSPRSIGSSVLRSAETSFALSGFTELVLEDLSVSSPWPLMMVPVDSRLRGTIDLNIACRLRFSIGHEGFLNHGDEAGGLATWNRRWCVLRGHTLKFWNYPREEETKEPLKIIELVDCVSDEVTTVDRKICAKPRTLLIETKRSRQPGDRNSIVFECKSACTIVRNLLSYDSARELEEWSGKINQVIVALEEWNVIGRRSQPSGI